MHIIDQSTGAILIPRWTRWLCEEKKETQVNTNACLRSSCALTLSLSRCMHTAQNTLAWYPLSPCVCVRFFPIFGTYLSPFMRARVHVHASGVAWFGVDELTARRHMKHLDDCDNASGHGVHSVLRSQSMYGCFLHVDDDGDNDTPSLSCVHITMIRTTMYSGTCNFLQRIFSYGSIWRTLQADI